MSIAPARPHPASDARVFAVTCVNFVNFAGGAR
jgi:hypothetical protein